jgi:dipeptidyl aminopeptidase/acylaminoacyl peptidase
MKKFLLVFAAVLATAVAVAAAGGAAPPPPPPPPHGGPPPHVVGQVYINDNTAGVNTVAGFDRHADGSLTPIPGSPFSVGGAGTGHGDASQGSLQLSTDRRYLLAVDAGSNQISALRIKPDGSLQVAEGSPVSSNGVNPVSIAVDGNLVYVANQGPGTNPGDTNYTGFTLNPGGHLDPISGSTVALPSDSKPSDVLFNKDGRQFVGTRTATSEIDSFTVGKDGQLTPAAGSPFSAQAFTPAQGWGQLGSEFSPTNPNQLFISDAHNAAGGGTAGLVSSFTDTNGALAPIGNSPVANDGVASCWVEISHDGRYMFVVNTGSATVSTYAIAPNGALTFLESTPAGQVGAGAEDARLAPDGNTLWVVDSGTDAVSGFAVNHDGSLSVIPSSPTPGPAGAAPTGIVVT